MRTILLSFKADTYEKLVSGEKIYEHRKNIPEGPIVAYLYLGLPVQSIVGKLILNNRASLETWLEKYSYDKDAVERIKKYMERNNYAIEITSFQNTNKLPLNVIREHIPNFHIPRKYHYIDDTPLLVFIENNLFPEGNVIENSFTNIDSSIICQN
ncbi:MAG: hypothetical protein PUE12_11135 [Oscillospiraceae bacterium]|nr:hypothetical protein [Oscillospiraceae bacterium]